MRLLIGVLFAAALLSAQEIRLVPLVSGLSQPIDIQNAADKTGRLFLAQQDGQIRLFRNGRLEERLFLDLRSRTRSTGECGLLGLAFPPRYAEKRHFYVHYTDTLCQNSIVARFHLTADDNLADAASAEVILTQRQPFANHNGGQLAFGPDGYLYVALGDGGSARDPLNNGQNRMTLLGKILRLDVESRPGPYQAPPSNPFVGDSRFLPEIWAWGLRNPWRFSFDRLTGDLFIADVGQDRAEEINFQPASSRGGENYGWRVMEGLRCLNAGCDPSPYVLPIHEYDTRRAGDVSVTGGYVYRGRRWPSLAGTYIYGDFASGRIWGLRRQGAGWANRLLLESGLNISTFGEDEDGEIYVADHGRGAIHRIEGLDPLPAPRFTASGVVNAASFEPGLAPGSAATVFVSGVTASPGVWAASSLPLPHRLAGVRVLIDGRQAPLYSVAQSNGLEQVNFQVPFETAGPTAQLVVERDGVSSDAVTVEVLASHPGVFTVDSTNALVIRSDTGQLASPSSPARRGEIITFYAVGLGAVDNQPATGEAAPRAPLATVRSAPAITVGDAACEVLFAGLAPDFAGIYQVNIRLPETLAAGPANLVVTAAGRRSPPVRLVLQ